MLRKTVVLSFAALPLSCLCAVSTVTIDSAENAFPTEDIVLDSGSKVVVSYSYRGSGSTMKAALIDKIKVNKPGDAEPYVAVILQDAGLNNDVDFSEQPYLWLSSPIKGSNWEGNKYQLLNGVYEPYGDIYRFGYGGTSWTGESGILVTNLVDNPQTGAARSVLVRGTGTTCLSAIGKSRMTFTGAVTLENGADLCFGNYGFPPNVSKIAMGNGTRLVIKTSTGSLPEKTELAVDGSVSLYVSGGTGEPAITIKGNVTGNGTITLTDQGGVQFYGANNTFNGEVKSSNTSAVDQKIVIGNGARFSWGDAKITMKRVEERLTLNTDSNITFSAVISGKGRLQKKGIGTLTLSQSLDRADAAAANIPVFEIEGGTIALGAEPAKELTGLMQLSRNAVFDACGHTSTVCLPSGRGTVANTGGSSLSLKGGWTSDVVFSGTLTCPCDVTIQGDGAWRVGETTVLTNDLTVSSGHMVADSLFATTNAVTLGDTARLDFSADDYLRLSKMTGLRLDFWDTSAEYYRIGQNHHPEILEAYLAKIQTADPMYSTDMKLFERLQNGDTSGTNKDCPFAKTLGAYNSGYANDPNLFAALFHGFLHITTPGAYSFRMRADDSGCVWLNGERLIRIAYGNSASVSVAVTRELAAGDHPFAVMFGEESGWDVMMVEIKGPDVPEWQCVPISMLKSVRDNGIRIGALKGTGTIGLTEKGQWPAEMSTEHFSGRVIVDANAKPASSGALALSSAQLRFASGWDIDTANWKMVGCAVSEEALGMGAVRLTPGEKQTEGGVNTMVPVPVTGPWSVEFDFQAVEPSHPSSVGDGFVVCLQSNGVNQCCGGKFGYDESSKRINCSSAYGVQHYLTTYLNYSVWMKGGVAYPDAGGFATNTSAFCMTHLKTKPMHVRFAYDGSENLIYAFSYGEKSFARTNSCAAADIAQLFPNGAHVGIWARNGDYYTSVFIRNVVLNIPGITDSTAPEFGGALKLGSGTVTVISGSAPTGYVTGPLVVAGTSNVSAGEMALEVSSPTWTFDLNGGSVAFSGDCRFAPAVTVELIGEAPKGMRLLADFTDTTGDLPTVTLGSGYPKRLSLCWQGRQLYLFRSHGMLLILK